VGDAAVALDPLSGAGICRSLASGFEAGRSILAENSGDRDAMVRYQQIIDELVHNSLAEQARLYRKVADWIDRPFWRRRILSTAYIVPQARL
jgi:flavin-dependent dehydrogenase